MVLYEMLRVLHGIGGFMHSSHELTDGREGEERGGGALGRGEGGRRGGGVR